MGLDMFLSCTKNTETNEGNVKVTWKEVYWRKANQIHNWFVQNIQNGYDDCAEYSLDAYDILELRNDCAYVLKHPEEAEDVLPTVGGMFFGSTDYGDWYWEEVERTMKELDEALKEDYTNFYYTSSW